MSDNPAVNSILAKFDIRGRSAFVTGGASGIGLAYAEAMAESGAAVTLSSINLDHAESEAARLRSNGWIVRAERCDVSDHAMVERAFLAHQKAYGRLDIAFANAGVDAGPGFWNPQGHRNTDGQIDTFDLSNWTASMAVNLNGVFHTVREAARAMKASGRKGSIIVTSSNAATNTFPIVGTPYMVAKAGVAHLVRQVALELAEFGIRVNCIAPGSFVTNIAGGVLKDPVVRATWAKMVPLGAMADTHEIKPLALYLASDASQFVTGSQMFIDGGVSLGHFNP